MSSTLLISAELFIFLPLKSPGGNPCSGAGSAPGAKLVGAPAEVASMSGEASKHLVNFRGINSDEPMRNEDFHQNLKMDHDFPCFSNVVPPRLCLFVL